MKSILFYLLLFSWLCSAAQTHPYNLNFNKIPDRWDEGIPIGNGWLGALIWQNNGKLRLSIDRVDLWDDRPMAAIDQLKFSFVKDQVIKKDYSPVQKLGDVPYEHASAPSKIPGAAIEFDIAKLGNIANVTLDIEKAVNTINFDSGVSFTSFVHATNQAGYFFFDGVHHQDLMPELVEPAYHVLKIEKSDDMAGKALTRLGYAKGKTIRKPGLIIYHQPTYNGNYYEVLVQWKRKGHRIEGTWTITNGQPSTFTAYQPEQLSSHLKWWYRYWGKSSLSIPDKLLDRQYKLAMYKFGSVTRANTPPISLQAIWTADNGSLPPWKGDLHFDLNVQMSYWPGYTANHLDLTASLTNWLWKVKEQNRSWTRKYFNTDGINVPGVTTISGKPMGGWIQYAMSPTTSLWLAHHFYLQWKYSMDDHFLKQKCYPYLSEVQRYIDNMLVKNQRTGFYQLPLSSSPEYFDNSLQAWFHQNTNYDLSLIHNSFTRYNEVTKAIGGQSGVTTRKQKQIASMDINSTGLTIAPGTDLTESHRHLSHLMAIYPLAFLNKDNPEDLEVMSNSMKTLEKLGTRQWLGFSFTWAAALYAQQGKGDSAVLNLKKFAQNFCSPNSFNLNGDQKGGQYSNYVYRPFTLETNFGFAEGIHQLLLQSEHGYAEIFPAIPASWKDVSFKNLRSQGAFLISASRENGINKQVRVYAEKGGTCKIKVPFDSFKLSGIARSSISRLNNGIIEFQTVKGQTVVFTNTANW